MMKNDICNCGAIALDENSKLVIDRVAEVAGYLWQKNWAERNGGNISVNLYDNIFYFTGTGQRMRDVAKSPLDFGAIIKVCDDWTNFEYVSEKHIKPTSELPSHLAIHKCLRDRGMRNTVVVHTHPNELIAISHLKKFLDADVLTKTLWSMIPESRIIVPKGVGVVSYHVPGSLELATATIEQLATHDVILWEKHGVLAVGNDVVECFDAIDTLVKCTQIYLFAKMAGGEPQGLNDEQLEELAVKFNL
jgi:rhamnulose-1-phosphate aldolase